LIVGPKQPLDKLVKVTKAKFNPNYGLYSVDCNAKFTWSVWIAGKEFPIDSNNMVWEIEPSKCVLGYDVWDPGFGGPEFILGKVHFR
jgi:hypothetical protein